MGGGKTEVVVNAKGGREADSTININDSEVGAGLDDSLAHDEPKPTGTTGNDDNAIIERKDGQGRRWTNAGLEIGGHHRIALEGWGVGVGDGIHGWYLAGSTEFRGR